MVFSASIIFNGAILAANNNKVKTLIDGGGFGMTGCWD